MSTAAKMAMATAPAKMSTAAATMTAATMAATTVVTAPAMAATPARQTGSGSEAYRRAKCECYGEYFDGSSEHGAHSHAIKYDARPIALFRGWPSGTRYAPPNQARIVLINCFQRACLSRFIGAELPIRDLLSRHRHQRGIKQPLRITVALCCS
ncbi:MAG: hypothetical protein P8Y71_12865 [Pseudolabrys sp.]